MNVERKLNSVGKRVFVENFDVFRRYAVGDITKEAAIERLVNLGVSNKAGASIRVGNSKLIFNAGKVVEALNIVLESERIPLSVVAGAKKIKAEIANSQFYINC